VPAASGGDLERMIREIEDLNRKGKMFYNLGEYTKAEPFYVRSLAITEKAVGPNHPNTAVSLDNLARLYREMGSNKKAEPLFVRALAINEKALGPNHPSTAASLNNLAGFYYVNAAYAKAEPLLVRALAINEKTSGSNHPDAAGSLNNLATLYQATGAYAKAEPLFVRALTIYEKTFGPNHGKTAMAMIDLAAFYQCTGAYAKAELLYVRTLSIYEKTVGLDSEYATYILSNLASLYHTTGAYSKAEPLFVRALAINEKTFASNHLNIAASLNDLASLYHTIGAYSKAEPLFVRALEIREKTRPDHPDTATSLNNLAELYRDVGDPIQAQAFVARGLSVLHKQLQNVLLLEESRRVEWQKSNLNFGLAASILKPEQVAQWVLRWKGIVLESVMEDRAAAIRLDKAGALAALQELQMLRQQLFLARTEEKESISRKISQMERGFAAKSVVLGRTRASADQVIEQVASALPVDGVLVDFISFKPPAAPKETALLHFGALVTNRVGDVTWVDLGEAKQVSQTLENYRSALSRGDSVGFASASTALYGILWKPLETVFAVGTKTVFLCPDGDLNFAPFVALSNEKGEFVGERYRVAYVGSSRDLLRESSNGVVEKQITIFANPDFSGKSERIELAPLLATRAASLQDFGGVKLASLPGAEAEGAVLARIAKGAGWQSDIYVGERATETAVTGVKSPGVLHLATHGFFLGERTNTGGLNGASRGMSVRPALGAESEVEKKSLSATEFERALSPMRRSGLAFAGAQRTFEAWGRGEAPAPSSDGVLTAEEAAGLELNGTWLVTLSACDTGIGKVQSGEGVFGLRRAFAMTGAKNLMMTLWPVSDATTVQIMADFYTKALANGHAWESLAEVQRDWLVKLRKEKGALAAVREAGPFVMAVMVNPAKAGLEGK
jgi:CHAT domain-containing protein/Tfp pilus assembly protein PilF